MSIPYLEGTGKLTKLMVNGKPFHARSGEIHNSSSSSLDYMEQRVWPALRGMNMNCVVVPIYWECVEPEPGKYDFTLIDGLIAQARREGMKLVFLWFGLWKNSASTYVPQWVKLDSEKYWLVKAAGNKMLAGFGGMMGVRIISPLCQEAVAADARAFGKVMAHIKEIDSEENTVITMQIENEIGVLGAARDYGPKAEAVYQQGVPADLAAVYGAGSWEKVFGDYGPEAFMAWHYGKAVNTIIEAGKAEYPIPMYVNAWLEQGEAGNYPSGGPQFKNYKIWKAAAPLIDAYGPDIYVGWYRDVVDEYASEGNPLFIPETRTSNDVVAYYLYAVGAHNALCFAPFGIEDMQGPNSNDPTVLAMLSIDASGMTGGSNTGRLLSGAYGAVANMGDLIECAHEQGTIHGFMTSERRADKEVLHLKDVDLEVTYAQRVGFAPAKSDGPKGGGFVIELGKLDYLVLAANCSVQFKVKDSSPYELDTLIKEEGKFVDDKWVPRRILNGDEGYRNSFGNDASFLHFKFYQA